MPSFPVTADTDLTTKGRRLNSWSFESTVAAGDIKLRDGSVAGAILVTIRVAIGDSKSQSYAKPIVFPNGVFVDVVTGTVVGAVDID